LMESVNAAKTKTRRLQAQLSLDTELHQLWATSDDGPWLTSILDRLLVYRPNLIKVLIDHSTFVEEAFDEHRQILAALEKHDLEQAVDRLKFHIHKSGSVLADLIEHIRSH